MINILPTVTRPDILNLHSFFGVSIADVLDILVVAFIIYKLFVWAKDTKVKTLFKGIGVLLGVSAMAWILSLTTVLWLITSLFSVGIIAIVVVFQPEIRKALEEVGKGKLNIPFTDARDDIIDNVNVTDEIIKALRILAKTRTGALIVIEKDGIALTDAVLTGVKLDAIVSHQIILNIFYDKTPLHDGAVLIRSNRIVAASCILPLTSGDIDQSLGTRHRAALGANETYGALAIVVSEETGLISVANNGKLKVDVQLDEVRKILLGENGNVKRRFTLWRASNEKDT